MEEELREEYLYGAAVQGIQQYIFRTNRLRDIVDASDLVEQICTTCFDDLVKDMDVQKIINAAGNIKCILHKRIDCETIVREFPMRVARLAPGITLSQAVVPIQSENSGFANNVGCLEQLLRAQRNCPMPSLTIGKLGVDRSGETGLPLMASDDKDSSTKPTSLMLCKKSFGSWLQDKKGPATHWNHSHLAFNVEDITDKNDWLAIIHADGNGLGQIVQRIGKDGDTFRLFSERLDQATIASANSAFATIAERYGFAKMIDEKKPIPLRPIVLGGDDMTIICRGDIAMAYVKEFLNDFELQTGSFINELRGKTDKLDGIAPKLTACAGIAFIKSSYPFYYGYRLAENLCDQAKKDAKSEQNMKEGLAPSCVMFHKVQDSFVEDFSQIEKRMLTTNSGESFVYGPYYLHEQRDRWTIKDICDRCEVLKPESDEQSNPVKTHLRRWLSEIHDNQDKANRLIERAQSLQSAKNARLLDELTHGETRLNGRVYPAYDVLSLYSILNQNTKEV